MTTTVCTEQLQKFHSSQQKSHHLHKIDVPPRKLLSRRTKTASSVSPKSNETAEQALFRKFLPYNNNGFDDDDDDPYSSDHFRMFEFKIRRCTRSRSHDWTECPFAHPGEKARRRDPRRVAYSGTVCPEFRRGACSRGDSSCEFAHGVFECWLHPARYRTEACKDGKHCKRKVCFFAHTPRQLRVLPPNCDSQKNSSPASSECKCNHCCVFCLHHQNSNNNNPNSPTSTLLSLSPPRLSYDEALAQLVASLDAMNVVDNGDNYSRLDAASGGGSYPWMDQSGFGAGGENNETYSLMNHLQQPTQFIAVSPSTPRHNLNIFGSGRSNSLLDTNASSFVFGTSIDDTPDIAWVDELLM
ncbi:hypothetical protein QQ045_015507 [Rhodiola kirilowii]